MLRCRGAGGSPHSSHRQTPKATRRNGDAQPGHKARAEAAGLPSQRSGPHQNHAARKTTLGYHVILKNRQRGVQEQLAWEAGEWLYWGNLGRGVVYAFIEYFGEDGFGGFGGGRGFWGQGGSPARLTWPGRPSPRAVPPSARRSPPPPPHRRDTRGTGAGTRVGPAEPLAPPAARKARSAGPRPDSCSGEAAAGNTKRLIQPR